MTLASSSSSSSCFSLRLLRAPAVEIDSCIPDGGTNAEPLFGRRCAMLSVADRGERGDDGLEIDPEAFLLERADALKCPHLGQTYSEL